MKQTDLNHPIVDEIDELIPENIKKVQEIKYNSINQIDSILNMDLQKIEYVKLSKTPEWTEIDIDLKNILKEEYINENIISILNIIFSSWYYVFWLSDIILADWKTKLFDILYTRKFKRKYLDSNILKLWIIKKANDEKFSPIVTNNKSWSYCNLEFQIWKEYNIDETIANLWTWWWNNKNIVRVWIYHNIILLAIKYCNQNTQKPEISKNDFFMKLKDFYAKKTFINSDKIEQFLKEQSLYREVWKNIALKVASEIPAINWTDANIEVVSNNLIIDRTPKDKDSKKAIDLSHLTNTTNNVSVWEILLKKISAEAWVNWYKLNWNIIEAQNWKDKIDLEKIAWKNAKIDQDKNWNAIIVSTISWIADFDPKNPTRKLNIESTKDLKWVNKKTWTLSEIIEWTRIINGDIDQKYDFCWEELIIKWSIIKSNVILSSNKDNLNVNIFWNITSSSIFAVWNCNIEINQVSNWSIIYAPNSNIKIKKVENWVIIICKSLIVETEITMAKTIISDYISCQNIILWESDTFIFWKKVELWTIQPRSWGLYITLEWKKQKKLDTELLNNEIEKRKKTIEKLRESPNLIHFYETDKKVTAYEENQEKLKKHISVFTMLSSLLEKHPENRDNANNIANYNKIKNEIIEFKKYKKDYNDDDYASIKFSAKSFLDRISEIEKEIEVIQDKIDNYEKEIAVEKTCFINSITKAIWLNVYLWSIPEVNVAHFKDFWPKTHQESSQCISTLNLEILKIQKSISTRTHQNYTFEKLYTFWKVEFDLNKNKA